MIQESSQWPNLLILMALGRTGLCAASLAHHPGEAPVWRVLDLARRPQLHIKRLLGRGRLGLTHTNPGTRSGSIASGPSLESTWHSP